MGIGTKATLLAAVLAVAGCSTIWNARKTQADLEPLSRDGYHPAATNRLDLSALTLSQLVDFAMTNHPDIASSALAVEDARLALKQIRADAPIVSSTPWFAPKLSASGGYSASSAGAKIDKLTARTEGNAYGSIELSIPVYDFGRHDAKARAGLEAVLNAELSLVDRGYNVFYNVSSSYFTLLEKCALLAVAKTNEVEYALHLEQAEQLLKSGEATELDVLRARLDLAQAGEKIVSAQSEVDTAGAEFQQALGVDASYGTRRDILDFPGDPLTFVMRGFPDTDYTVRDAFDLACTNAPAMRIARSQLRAASADVDYAVADLMPDITLSASFSWTDPLWYWHWGASAAQSLFQGFRKTTAVDRAVNAMCRAAKEVDAEELDLTVKLEKAVAARDTAEEAQRTASVSLKHARDNLEMVREEFRVGEATRIEFTDAVSDYVTALGSRISAFYSKQRAECAVFSLVGIYPVYEEKRLMEETK